MVRIKQGIDFTLWSHTIGQTGYSVSRAPVQEQRWCLLTTVSLLLCTLRPLSLSITEHAQQHKNVGGFLPGGGVVSKLQHRGQNRSVVCQPVGKQDHHSVSAIWFERVASLPQVHSDTFHASWRDTSQPWVFQVGFAPAILIPLEGGPVRRVLISRRDPCGHYSAKPFL